MPLRFSQLSDPTWDIGVLHLGEPVGLQLGWLAVADLTGSQVIDRQTLFNRALWLTAAPEQKALPNGAS